MSRRIAIGRAAVAALFFFLLAANAYGAGANTAEIQVTAEPAALASTASVLINGKAVGGLPLTIRLQAGRYLFEVEVSGAETWRRWVDVKAGVPQVLNAALAAKGAATVSAPAVTSGSLLITADDLSATVSVNGKAYGTVPVLVQGIVGECLVQVRSPSGEAQRKVIVAAGKTEKLRFELQKKQVGATLRLLAEPSDAVIWVNGDKRGKAPLTVTGLATGKHLVEGRLEGFATARQSLFVEAGQEATLRLVLKALPLRLSHGMVRVASQPPGATVFIDGKAVGKAPLLRDKVVVGAHLVALRLDGYQEALHSLAVEPGRIAGLSVTLQRKDASSQPSSYPASNPTSRPKGDAPFYTHDAWLVPPRFVAVDASAGFPYLFAARLSTGLFTSGSLAMDAGVILKSYGAMTEVAGQLRLRLFDRDPFAAALFFEVGGGGGARSRNTFSFLFGGIGSWAPLPWLRASARLGLEAYSDRNCPAAKTDGESGVCSAPPADLASMSLRERMGGVRLMIAASGEVPITPWLSIFAELEAAAAADRAGFRDAFAAVMPGSDPHIYARLGVTLRR